MRAFPGCLIPLLLITFQLADVARAEPPAVDPVLNNLGKSAISRFHFRQTKTIAALERPLVSEGRMLFARDHGILWAVEKPRPSLFIITPSGISKREGERVIADIRGSENRVVEGFTKVFLSLFSGDLTELQAAFTISTESRGKDWTIQLTPKDSRLAQFIQGITLSGGAAVSLLELREGSGDSSRVELTESDAGTGELSADERRTFSGTVREK